MKIGILTLPLHANYGGILQAFALQTALERMGHNVVVINQDLDIERNPLEEIKIAIGYCIRKYILGKKDIGYSTARKLNIERKELEQYTKAFIDKYIHTYAVHNLEIDSPRALDALVVGSDQVWRRRYFEYFYKCGIENAFLKFAEKESIKRIAYAASFGTDEWEYTQAQTDECSRLLRLFDAVGVREKSAVSLCNTRLKRDDAELVLDPTFLLDKSDYIRLVENLAVPSSPGNLMCYVLDGLEEKRDFIQQVAEERHLVPFYTNSRIDDESLSPKDRIQPPLECWLRGFMDAQFVITDSFHACVFSIIFNKPFIVLGNKERGMARFNSLLSLFSLDDHLITSFDDYKHDYAYSIDDEVGEKYVDYMQFSRDFLKDSLQ